MRTPCSVKADINNGDWTKQEDQLQLIHDIATHGEAGSKRTLPKAAGLHHCGKSRRLSWINSLRPVIKRGNFAYDEEDLIIKLHALLGNRWSLIAGRLPGRTENEVEKYWNCHLKRKLVSMGTDRNNPRLNQSNIPRPQNLRISPELVQSTPSKTFCARNCLQVEDETSSGLHDLNLNLTIAVPSPSPSLLEKKLQNNEYLKMAEEIESDQFPTLHLFR